jgi:hypothetical protein
MTYNGGGERHRTHLIPGSGDPQSARLATPDSLQQDSFVDIDMDAIIQSFIIEQQTTVNDGMSHDPTRAYQLQQPGLMPNNQYNSSGESQRHQWGMYDLTGDEVFDDALFGMNNLS